MAALTILSCPRKYLMFTVFFAERSILAASNPSLYPSVYVFAIASISSSVNVPRYIAVSISFLLMYSPYLYKYDTSSRSLFMIMSVANVRSGLNCSLILYDIKNSA